MVSVYDVFNVCYGDCLVKSGIWLGTVLKNNHKIDEDHHFRIEQLKTIRKDHTRGTGGKNLLFLF